MGILKIPPSFYTSGDVVAVSRTLLGKFLVTKISGHVTAGMILETEAYAGTTDRASHAYGGRRTQRTETMYREGGIAYIYLCYGIHHLFNVVTHKAGVPHAVLIRALLPSDGLDIMLKRRKKDMPPEKLCTGPGALSQALGIRTHYNGINLQGDTIWLEDRGIIIRNKDIAAGPRIGIDYSGKDAALPYRFVIKSPKM